MFTFVRNSCSFSLRLIENKFFISKRFTSRSEKIIEGSKSLLEKRMSSITEVDIHPDEYPQAYRDNSIIEELHGVKVTFF